MKNYSRKELAKSNSAMNQLRNVIYHLIRFLQNEGKNNKSIKKSLQRMGVNIAKTESKLFDFDGDNPEDVIKQIYDLILGSKITISKNYNSTDYIVEDKKCCICKYHRKDITVAPCEIIHSMVSELLRINGYKVDDGKVEKSMALGDLSCLHTYPIQRDDA